MKGPPLSRISLCWLVSWEIPQDLKMGFSSRVSSRQASLVGNRQIHDVVSVLCRRLCDLVHYIIFGPEKPNTITHHLSLDT
jgi:hypothetical protein